MTQELGKDMHFQISEKSSYLLLVKVGALSQIGLELRYGREDEELMGLQFCNEMILASQSLYCTSDQQDDTLENLTESAGCYLKHFKIGKIDYFSLQVLSKCVVIP